MKAAERFARFESSMAFCTYLYRVGFLPLVSPLERMRMVRGVLGGNTSVNDCYPAGLYDGRPPAEHVDTSREAADSVASNAASVQARILRWAKERAALGFTDDECEAVFGFRHQTASARRRELVILGDLKFGGEYRKTRSGRRAQVWVYSEVI